MKSVKRRRRGKFIDFGNPIFQFNTDFNLKKKCGLFYFLLPLSCQTVHPFTLLCTHPIIYQFQLFLSRFLYCLQTLTNCYFYVKRAEKGNWFWSESKKICAKKKIVHFMPSSWKSRVVKSRLLSHKLASCVDFN